MSRLRVLLPALWVGLLLAIGGVAAPALFALLPAADAGRVVARLFAQEAYAALVFSVLLCIAERQAARANVAAGGSIVTPNLLLVLGALFCTVAGYFAVLPMMDATRAGTGSVSFATLHGISAGFFVLKGLLVLTLAWRVSGV